MARYATPLEAAQLCATPHSAPQRGHPREIAQFHAILHSTLQCGDPHSPTQDRASLLNPAPNVALWRPTQIPSESAQSRTRYGRKPATSMPHAFQKLITNAPAHQLQRRFIRREGGWGLIAGNSTAGGCSHAWARSTTALYPLWLAPTQRETCRHRLTLLYWGHLYYLAIATWEQEARRAASGMRLRRYSLSQGHCWSGPAVPPSHQHSFSLSTEDRARNVGRRDLSSKVAMNSSLNYSPAMGARACC